MEKVGVEMKFGFDKIEKMSEIIEHHNTSYCRVYYDGSITINLLEQAKPMSNNYLMAMREAYGEDNVTFDSENYNIFIDAHKSMIATLVRGEEEWKYFEYNESEMNFLEQLLPERVLDALK